MENMYRPGGKDYIYVNDEKILKIDNQYIESLKKKAQRNNLGKCTMCLHNDIRKHVHEMINLCPQGTYIRPHSHPFKSETNIIIEGKQLIVIFDESGEIIDEYEMRKDQIFISRIDKGIIHTNVPLTNIVRLEVVEGPFEGKNDSLFPKWSPELGNEDGIHIIMNKIYRKWEEK